MAGGNVSQAIASQIEHVRPDLEMLTLLSSVFWKRLKARTDVTAVSNRPTRIPFEAFTGGKPRTGNFDGGGLGRGSGPTQVPGYLSCVSLLQANEYTALAEWSTDSKEKSIEDYVARTQKEATEVFAGFLDSLCQQDGSFTYDSVVSTGTNSVVVNNVNYFGDGWDVDIWSALGGTFRGTVTILSAADTATNTLYFTGALPSGTTGGDLLLVNQAAGQANTGLFGIKAYQVTGNTGNWMGIQKSGFPGKFSVPNVNITGALTPAAVRATEAQMRLALGDDNDGSEVMAHCNVDSQAAWENNTLSVQRVVMNEVKGDQSVDMLRPKAPKMIAGRPVLANVRATPGRIDFLDFAHWFKIETKAVDYYEVGGQTVFPAYGGDGGLMTSMIFYLVTMMQVGNGQPRRNAYISGFSIPTYYFGH